MIRKATRGDVQIAFENVYEKLFEYEEVNGSKTNWKNGVYPTVFHLEKAFNEDTLFVLEEDGGICACVILNKHQPPEYKNVKWEYATVDSKILVIHTLCVSPDYKGKGYGKELVRYAEKYAVEKGCDVIRFDTYVENKPAESMYLSLGYRRVGVLPVLHEGVIQEDLILFEKSL